MASTGPPISDFDQVVQVADLAHGLLVRRGTLPGSDLPLTRRLAAAGIYDIVALDALISTDRHIARAKLGLQTMAEADRILRALGRARKELEKQASLT